MVGLGAEPGVGAVMGVLRAGSGVFPSGRPDPNWSESSDEMVTGVDYPRLPGQRPICGPSPAPLCAGIGLGGDRETLSSDDAGDTANTHQAGDLAAAYAVVVSA